jgi:hypothetical protein
MAPGVGFEPTRPQEATSCLVLAVHASISRLAPYLARRPRHMFTYSCCAFIL